MRPDIDAYYWAILKLVASRGTCPRRKVAAILVDSKGRLVATGYNGPPSGQPHCIDEPCPGHPDNSTADLRAKCEAIHAEVNAVLQAGSSRRDPHTLYCSTTPCFPCAKLLVAAGIQKVIAASVYAHDQAGLAYLAKAGVELQVVESEPEPELEGCAI